MILSIQLYKKKKINDLINFWNLEINFYVNEYTYKNIVMTTIKQGS